MKRLIRGSTNPIAQIVKRSSELSESYYQRSQQKIKITTTSKDSCFLTKSGIVFVKEIKSEGYLCEIYKKKVLDSFFHVFGIPSTDLNIYVIKRGTKFVMDVLSKKELLKKCVVLSYKSETIVMPLLHTNF